MFHNRLLKTLAVFALLAVLMTSIGYLLLTTAPSAEAALSCGISTINLTGLSASEVYYAQRFMVSQPCPVQPVPELAQQGFSPVLTLPGLSASEVYYAQKAQRFMPFTTPLDIAGLPQ